MSRRTMLVWNSGKTILRTIFSTTRGTEQMRRGRISAKASATSVGVGMRVRKKIWLPKQNWKSTSSMSPYIWAMGRMHTQLLPRGICLPIIPLRKSKLLHSAR